jgi:hypothetical protein
MPRLTASARALVSALSLAMLLPAASSGARIVINNVDQPGVGLNDPTPAAPVGGNPGTTRGEQRRIAIQHAADIWGSILASDVEIVVQVAFQPPPPYGPLFCAAQMTTPGLAGAVQMFKDFPGAPRPGVWYPSALANALAGFDLTPGPPDPSFLHWPPNDDFVLILNGHQDDNPNCSRNDWYYGLDNNHGIHMDLVTRALHEMGHGLGLQNAVDETTGKLLGGFPDVYSLFTFDTTTGKHWHEMTDAERAASALNCRHVVWDGPAANAASPPFLGPGEPALIVTGPPEIARAMAIGPATFGGEFTFEGVAGTIVYVEDSEGNPRDGCQPLTPESAAKVRGQIALADRGGCVFEAKAKTAQAAGARAAIFGDVTAFCPPVQLGGFLTDITIPLARIGKADRDAILGANGPVSGRVGLRKDVRPAADEQGRLRLWPSNPPLLGSSIEHFDILASPSLLMEFDTDPAQPHAVDLAAFQLMDLGWKLASTRIGDCDSGVPNFPLPDSTTLQGRVDRCGEEASPADCLAKLAASLDYPMIADAHREALSACARRAFPAGSR